MTSFILYISGVFFGWYIGNAYQLYKIRTNLKSIINSIESDISIETVDTENLALLTVEEHNNTIFVYDQTTDEFVCQGITIDEVAENFSKRNANIKAKVKYNNTEMFFIDGKVIPVLTK